MFKEVTMAGKVFLILFTLLLSAAVLPAPSRADSVVTTQWVSYTSGTDTVKAYCAIPDGEGPFPAVILIHEWWGLNDWIKENAKDFARRGYLALAIDLYRGRVAASSDEAHELMRGLPEDRAAKDLKSAFTYLQTRPDVKQEKIGAIGWCMGGGYSLTAALTIQSLAAAVVCYGRLVSEEEEIQKIACPVLGIFGETDRGIPAASVKAFERSAQKLDKNVRVVIYPKVGHAFMNPNNEKGYDASTAQEAWQRIYAFFETKLMGKQR
jgi:carboxymethylenebutenolidase